MSLKRRLTLTHALVGLLAVLIVAVLTTVLVQRNFARLRTEAVIERAADRLADYYTLNGDWNGVDRVFRRQLAGIDAQGPARRPHIQLLDANNQLVFDSQHARTQLAGVAPIQGIKLPVLSDSSTVGTIIYAPGQLEQVQSATEQEFLQRFYLSVAGGSVLAILAALGIGLLITRQLTTPLRSMTVAARRLAAGERHTPLTVPAEAELGALALAFNTMAADLDHQEQLRRQLVADIAHELRTPLSVLRLQVESLEDGVAQPTAETLSSLGQEVGLLQRLVEDLRLLSLADAGQMTFALANIDPHDLVAHAATMYAPRARQQGIELRVNASPVLPKIRADQQRLAQVLGNLIENALRYTPAGGVVTLGVQQKVAADAPSLVGTVVFSVADSGPGIAPGDLAHIFDRFYRADRARSRETGGSGLGLAIVQRLTEALGGQVSVESELGNGTVFRVALPVAAALRQVSAVV